MVLVLCPPLHVMEVSLAEFPFDLAITEPELVFSSSSCCTATSPPPPTNPYTYRPCTHSMYRVFQRMRSIEYWGLTLVYRLYKLSFSNFFMFCFHIGPHFETLLYFPVFICKVKKQYRKKERKITSLISKYVL